MPEDKKEELIKEPKEKVKTAQEKKGAKANKHSKDEAPKEEKPDSKSKGKKKEEKFKAKKKPELSPEEKLAMDLRREKKRKTPHFRRQEWFRYDRLDERWRKPRGLHSKLRRNYKYRPLVVSTGFMGPKAVRGRHPSGFEEVLVYNHKDLEGLDPKKQAIRIGHSVGYLKRMYIAIQANEMDLRILNFNRQAHKELLDEAKKRGIELPSAGVEK